MLYKLYAMLRPSGCLSIHHGNGCHIDDVIHAVAALQDMNRFVHPHQDRTDRLGASQVVQQFVADVAGVQVREDQDVGRWS